MSNDTDTIEGKCSIEESARALLPSPTQPACKNCGSTRTATGTYCWDCGRPLAQPASASEEESDV